MFKVITLKQTYQRLSKSRCFWGIVGGNICLKKTSLKVNPKHINKFWDSLRCCATKPPPQITWTYLWPMGWLVITVSAMFAYTIHPPPTTSTAIQCLSWMYFRASIAWVNQHKTCPLPCLQSMKVPQDGFCTTNANVNSGMLLSNLSMHAVQVFDCRRHGGPIARLGCNFFG